MISEEKQLLIRIEKNEHNKICQQTSLKLTNCLCFQSDLKKLINQKKEAQVNLKKKRLRKNHIHWDKFNCGSKNKTSTSDIKLVTCQHCKKSNDYLSLQKIN